MQRPLLNGRFLVTPPTTDMSLVFTYDQRKNKFDRNFYSPALTDGKISYEHMELFLRDAEEILRKKIGKVKTLFKLFALWMIVGLFTMMFLAVDSLDTIDMDIDSSDDGFEGDGVDAAFMTIIGYMFFVVFVGLLLCKFHRRSQNKARKAIQSLIDKKYPMFGAQGLRWSMPAHFPHWIELWKDYKAPAQAPYIQQGYQAFAPYALAMPTQIVPQQFMAQPQYARPQVQSEPRHEQRGGLAQPLLGQQQDVNLYPQLNRSE